MEAVSLTGVDPHGVDVDDETGSEELLGLGVFHRFWPQKKNKLNTAQSKYVSLMYPQC
jgi:hypothetical protein